MIRIEVRVHDDSMIVDEQALSVPGFGTIPLTALFSSIASYLEDVATLALPEVQAQPSLFDGSTDVLLLGHPSIELP